MTAVRFSKKNLDALQDLFLDITTYIVPLCSEILLTACQKYSESMWKTNIRSKSISNAKNSDFSEHLTASICLTLLLEVIYFVLQLWLCQNRNQGEAWELPDVGERYLVVSIEVVYPVLVFNFGFFKCAFAVSRKKNSY